MELSPDPGGQDAEPRRASARHSLRPGDERITVADLGGTRGQPGPGRRRRISPLARWRHQNGWIRFVSVLFAAAVLATLLRTWVVAPYFIPSASMETTLHGCTGCNNDHVLVDKLSYSLHSVHRGDVVVFHRPTTWQVSETLLIKRVVGLPGDVLSTQDGVVYVNGRQLVEPYIDRACTSGTTGLPQVQVPAGEVFVMGDNRCDSEDSRVFGPVPIHDIVGRAFVIVWPLGRIHWL
jgi:signal peptidase I